MRIGKGCTLCHNEQHTTTICYQLAIFNRRSHVEYGAINLLGTTNRVALCIIAGVALRCENNAKRNRLAPNDWCRLDTRSHSLENIGNIAIYQWQNDLCLRIAKAGIKLDNLHSISGFHQTAIENSRKRTALCDHSFCRRTHHALHSKCQVLVGNKRQRCIGSHTARIRALIAIVSALMVLCHRHRIYILALDKAHQRELRTFEIVLHNDTAFTKAVVKEHIAQSLTSLIYRFGNNYALTCCQAVVFEYGREWASLYIGNRLVVVVERLISRCRNIVLRHQLLGKLFRGLDARSRLSMTEDFQPLLAELIGNTHRQSSLRTYYGQVDSVLLNKRLQLLDIGILYRYTLRLTGNTRISGCAVNLINARRTEQRIDNSVFTTSRTND